VLVGLRERSEAIRVIISRLTTKQHREEAVCEAKGEIRGVGRIARAERSNPCYYLKTYYQTTPRRSHLRSKGRDSR